MMGEMVNRGYRLWHLRNGVGDITKRRKWTEKVQLIGKRKSSWYGGRRTRVQTQRWGKRKSDLKMKQKKMIQRLLVEFVVEKRVKSE